MSRNSMRVDERNLTEQASASAARASESQRVQVTTQGSAGSSTKAGDHVDLSSLAGRISRSMQTLSAQAAQRASQLQKEVRAGSYQPDARQISHAMVSASRAAAGG